MAFYAERQLKPGFSSTSEIEVLGAFSVPQFPHQVGVFPFTDNTTHGLPGFRKGGRPVVVIFLGLE